ncbi:hypothetical protein F5Y04DRAFT_174212 [Hypomontagnella monticulosa]|nr:hypothetical protein F5Y04DRAFT_174212 [Hypomontagnella monticulosa]
MVHPEQARRTRSTSLEVIRTNQMYSRSASVAARYPAAQSAFLSVEYPVGVPRDQRGDWILYDQKLDYQPFSQQESGSKYSQPLRSQSVRSGDSGVSHREYQGSANRNQYRQPPSIHRNYASSRPRTESSPSTSLVSGRSQRTHKGDAVIPGATSWGDAVESSSRDISKRRRVSQDSYRDSNVAPSRNARDHAPHIMNRAKPTLTGVQASDSGGKCRISRKDRHEASIPPKAPKIPRLPTPDLDDVEYGKDDVTSRQFCACCKVGDGSEVGSSQECAVAKMERQLYEAKAYITRKDSLAR